MFKTRWSVFWWRGALTALGGGALLLGGLGGSEGEPPFLLQRSPVLSWGGMLCSQPEAQRGQVVCLRPHSERVTMATWYLSVPVLWALLETPPHPSPSLGSPD